MMVHVWLKRGGDVVPVAARRRRDPASVNVRTLLPKIFELVPDTSVEEVVAMLRWSARKDMREADKLEKGAPP